MLSEDSNCRQKSVLEINPSTSSSLLSNNEEKSETMSGLSKKIYPENFLNSSYPDRERERGGKRCLHLI